MTAIPTEALLARDPDAWQRFVVPLAESEQVAVEDDLVPRLLAADRFDAWMEFARQALEASGRYVSVREQVRRIRDWAAERALEHLGDGPDGWRLRLDLLAQEPSDDGGLATATDLIERLSDADEPELLGLAYVYQARGAFTEHNAQIALSAATQAEAILRKCGSKHHPAALRQLAAANVYAGKVEHAMKLYDVAFQLPRAGFFSVGSVTRFKHVDDARLKAIDEVRDVGMWATATTPEWARSLGVLANLWGANDEFLRAQFETTLRSCVEDDANQGAEVVARQALQRGHLSVAVRALEVQLEVHPDDSWAAEQLEGLAVRARFEAAREKLESAPNEAIAELFEVFEELQANGTSAESELGFAVCEALLAALVGQGDRRAVDVQTSMWEAKLERWGECPAAWLEQQNLGTIYADFGEFEEAEHHLNHARARMVDHFGADHPQVARVDRNLARVASMRG